MDWILRDIPRIEQFEKMAVEARAEMRVRRPGHRQRVSISSAGSDPNGLHKRISKVIFTLQHRGNCRPKGMDRFIEIRILPATSLAEKCL